MRWYVDGFCWLGIQISVQYGNKKATHRPSCMEYKKKIYHVVKTDSILGRDYFKCWTLERNKVQKAGETVHGKGLGHKIPP